MVDVSPLVMRGIRNIAVFIRYRMLAPNYANDAKTFLKHLSDCLFYFCSTCADAWSRNKIKHCLFYFCSTCADCLILIKLNTLKKYKIMMIMIIIIIMMMITELIQEIDRYITVITEDTRETAFLFQTCPQLFRDGMHSPESWSVNVTP